MRCNNCGKNLYGNEAVCPVCGKAMAIKPTPPRPVSQPQPSAPQQPMPNPKNNGNGNTGFTPNPQPIQPGLNNHSIPSNSKFAAIIADNKKRNMLIAAVAVLLVVIITILVFALRPASSKIKGIWLTTYTVDQKGNREIVEQDDQVTWKFENGTLLISSVNSNKTEEGYYKIEGDILEICDDDYKESKLMGHSKRYVIEKLTSSELILRKVDTNKKIIFKAD